MLARHGADPYYSYLRNGNRITLADMFKAEESQNRVCVAQVETGERT